MFPVVRPIKAPYDFSNERESCKNPNISTEGQKILDDVLYLPEEERAEIAARLIQIDDVAEV